MRKNLVLKKNTSIKSTKQKTKIMSALSTPKSRRIIPLPRTRKQLYELITPKIKQIWQMVSSLGLENSHPSITRFLTKKMAAKGYTNAELILQVLRNAGVSKNNQKKVEEINMEVLFCEIEQIKEELEGFLKKRFLSEMDIMRRKIQMADGQIADCIDVDEYQKLVCSFRPLLITNSTDLAQEYQTIQGPSYLKAARSSRMQQYRFAKLGQLQKQICQLHNRNVQMKQDHKLFPSCLSAITNLF